MLALVGTTYLVKEAGPAVSTWVGDKAGWVSDRVYEDPTVNYLMNDIVNYMLSEGRYSNW